MASEAPIQAVRVGHPILTSVPGFEKLFKKYNSLHQKREYNQALACISKPISLESPFAVFQILFFVFQILFAVFQILFSVFQILFQILFFVFQILFLVFQILFQILFFVFQILSPDAVPYIFLLKLY